MAMKKRRKENKAPVNAPKAVFENNKKVKAAAEEKKCVTFWLAASEKEELTALARERGKTVTQILREGIESVKKG